MNIVENNTATSKNGDDEKTSKYTDKNTSVLASSNIIVDGEAVSVYGGPVFLTSEKNLNKIQVSAFTK